MSNIQSVEMPEGTSVSAAVSRTERPPSAKSPMPPTAKSPMPPSKSPTSPTKSPHPTSAKSHIPTPAKIHFANSKTHNPQSGSKTPGIPKTPPSKPGSRNDLPPAPQLTVIKYTIDIDVIKCPICMDVFRSPRVVPCGHSMCFECLNSLILYTESAKIKESFPCPVCQKNIKPRDKTAVRQKWANQFPVNATILRLLRNAQQKNPNDNGSHKAFCEVCLVNNKTRPATTYCNTCLEHQCDICSKYHEQREDAREHEVISFHPKEDPAEKSENNAFKSDRRRKSIVVKDVEAEKRVKINTPQGASRMTPASTTVVAQTVTAADSVAEKIVTKLGHFNGNAPNDSAASDFRAVTFITNNKVVLADHANKKLKVFDITHKTRVELVADLNIRADPSSMCRIDDNSVAVLTERLGAFHIRLFTIRDKIFHSVHRTVEGVPLGIGFIQNIVVCSFLDQNSLAKYRLTKSQQRKVGVIVHDRSGNDLFHHPGAICYGTLHGAEVLYVADETEYGVTVTAINLHGDKKSSVFFECALPKPKSPKKSANGTVKSGRKSKTQSAKSTRKDEPSTPSAETVNPKTADNNSSRKPPVRAPASPAKETAVERLSGRHIFRRVDDFGRVPAERRGGREIERTPMPNVLKNELTIDLNKLISEENDLNETVGKPNSRRTSRIESKAVERAQKRPVGKVLPQKSTDQSARTSEKTSSGNPESTINLNSTITSDSTIGTVTFAVPPKLVYRADSIDVDNAGNVYVCMSSLNTIHQMSPDGRVKRELLTEKDGIVAPKVVCFSLKNDVFLVTCLKSSKVLMFRLK